MGQVLLAAALVHPICSARAGAQSAGLPPDLLQREESEAQAHRSHFAQWCQGELLSQTKQRGELLQLRDQVSPPDGDAVLLDSLSQQSDKLAQSLERTRKEASALKARQVRASAALADLGRQVATLAAVEEELVRKAGAQEGAEPPGLRAVRGLLARARESQQQAKEEASRGPEGLEERGQALEAQYRSKAATLAQLRAQRRAASVGQSLVLAALEDEDAFLADLQSLCNLGQTAYRRLDEALRPALRDAAVQISTRSQPAASDPSPPSPSTAAPSRPPPPALPPPPQPRRRPAAVAVAPQRPPAAAVEAAPPPDPEPAVAAEVEEAPPPAPPKLRRRAAAKPAAPVRAAQHAGGEAAAPAARQPSPARMVQQAPAPRKAPPVPPPDAEDAVATDEAEAVQTQAAAQPPPAVDDSSGGQEGGGAAAQALPQHRHRRHVTAKHTEEDPSMADATGRGDSDLASQEPRGRLRSTARSAHAGTPRVAPADAGSVDDEEDAAPAVAQKAPTSSADGAPAAEAWSPARKDRLKRLEKDLNGLQTEEPPSAPSGGRAAARRGGGGGGGGGGGAISDLQGGWQSLVKKGKKKGARKHVFNDQASKIADLVQTPTTYTAWHPEHSDAALAASAKSELLAAERAFDEDRPPSFLQLDGVAQQTALEQRLPPAADRTGAAAGSATAAAAGLLLERYARSLGSAALLQLSRTRLDLQRLATLWREVQEAGDQGGREAQAVSWCRDFKREAAEKAEVEHSNRVKASANLTEVEAEQRLLEQEVAAQERVLQVFSEGSQHLKALLSEVKERAASLLGTIRSLEKEAQEGASQDESGVRESLGRAEGLATSGTAEVEDLVSSALTRRQDAERSRKSAVDRLRDRLAVLAHARDSLKAEEGRQNAAEQAGSLRAHYDQICKWTLEDLEARRHKEEAERDAIRAALAVLSAQ